MKRLLATVLCAAPAAAQGGTIDNQGREFLYAFLPSRGDGTAPIVELHLTSAIATTVLVEYPATAPVFTQQVILTPGQVQIVPIGAASLTAGPSNGWASDSIRSNLVRATADEPFASYMVNRKRVISDAALALPVTAMGRRHIVLDYDTVSTSTSPLPAHFVVYAAHDGTMVTITPPTDMVGHPANQAFSLVLNRGEGYLGVSTGIGAAGSLTGTQIDSTLPVGVTNGAECPFVPSDVCCCDNVFEVAQPVETWGSEVLIANLPFRPRGSFYRIVAAEDATTVRLDGTVLATLDAGEFHRLEFLAGDHRITGDKPIFVAQFMTSQQADTAIGDPSMGNVIPSDQFRSSYTFSTVGGNQFSRHFLTLFVEDADVGSVLLDGAPIPGAALFRPFATVPGSGFSIAIVDLPEGPHTTTTPGLHGITIAGYNSFDSYLYPGGASVASINCAGSSEDLGGGFPACQGTIPALSMAAASCPRIGSTIDLLVTDGPPGAHGCLLIGANRIGVQIPRSGVLEAGGPYVFLGDHSLDGSGSHGWRLPVPLDVSLNGADFYLQAAYLESTPCRRLSLTNTLKMTLAP